MALYLLCLTGCHVRPDQSQFTPITSAGPEEAFAQLRCAKIPGIEGIAAHCWLVLWDQQQRKWTRWEVWQKADMGAGLGHVWTRSGAGSAVQGVGAGKSWALAQWKGESALRIRRICSRPEAYPWADTYAYWPGPNSNTYIAWVLLQADVEASLPPAAIGARYLPVYFTGPKCPLDPEGPKKGSADEE